MTTDSSASSSPDRDSGLNDSVDTADDDQGAESQESSTLVTSPYTAHMVERIANLPLPMILKKYLNYHRDF